MKKPKLKNPFKKQEKPFQNPEQMMVPKEWLTPENIPKIQEKYTIIDKANYRKFRIPGLRTSKRIIAGILLLLNFFISQATLTGPVATQGFAVFFLLNSFILVDYLWKTRAKTEVKK
jgi:hypothetical protein